MEIDTLRAKKLTFKDTFIYVKEILFLNFFNFIKILFFWFLLAFLFSFSFKASLAYFVVFCIIIAYVSFYLLYLTFISQARATIDKKKRNVFFCFKKVSGGFFKRKGLDLLQLVPAILVISLVMFFPSSIFAIPLAFIITLATLIFAAYTIFVQPVVVIRKLAIIPAIRYSITLISGYLTFVIGLIFTLAIACAFIYIPLIFIPLSSIMHLALGLSLLGIDILLFAIMITVVYTNLEVAWSVGFKNYSMENVSAYNPESNHEFTEFFNKVPEVQIKDENKENENLNLYDK